MVAILACTFAARILPLCVLEHSVKTYFACLGLLWPPRVVHGRLIYGLDVFIDHVLKVCARH